MYGHVHWNKNDTVGVCRPVKRKYGMGWDF